MTITFDLYGTLVTGTRRDEPWKAVATALDNQGVSVPNNWESAYRSSYIEADPHEEISLVEHTRAALESRDVYVKAPVVRESLLAAFDSPVSIKDGAESALRVAADEGPVGILSNCSLPGLVDSTLDKVDFPVEFDAIVTSVGCGWRKPHNRAFEIAAATLGCECSNLIHVGDDPRTDGGGRTAEVRVMITTERSLSAFSSWVEAAE